MISKEKKSQIILCAYHDFAARYLIYSGIMKNLLLDESIEILAYRSKDKRINIR